MDIIWNAYASGTEEASIDPAVMNYLFNCYEDNIVTEEQVRRVLEPILLMIQEGRFSNRSRHICD